MSLFLLSFFLVYGGLHYYILSKVRAAFAPGPLPSILLAFFFLFMVAAPVLVYFAGRYGGEGLAQGLGWAGFTWMGLAFLFFAASVTLDLYRLLLAAGSLLFSGKLPSPAPGLQFLLPLLFALGAGLYGHFEARQIRTERLVISTPKIPAEIGRFRIALISDVHLGLIVREDRLSRILREVKKADPDLFLSAGDLVDAQPDQLDGLAVLLKEIRPRFGKFAITGNHEFYAGLGPALDFTRRAGFIILRGEGLTVGGLINLAGVDDPAGRGSGLSREVPEEEILSRLPRDKFTLLLKHRPVWNGNSRGLFDLQLSGHLHGGQIFPFRLFTRLFFDYLAGRFQLPGGALLYVSRGTGTWGPPIRFLSPPEVTVIDLLPRK